jgi:hypothetical protein
MPIKAVTRVSEINTFLFMRSSLSAAVGGGRGLNVSTDRIVDLPDVQMCRESVKKRQDWCPSLAEGCSGATFIGYDEDIAG